MSQDQDSDREARFTAARLDMVANQLASRDIHDARVLEAFRKVPRHLFVPRAYRSDAYADHPLDITSGQTISQPYMVALMTQALELSGPEKVLEIGTGSGYQTAILAELAARVFSVERIADLSRRAQGLLVDLGYSNIEFFIADGTRGLEARAPYDAILVAAAAPGVPASLVGQLADGGRLVIPVGTPYGQMLKRLTRKRNRIESEDLCPCIFVRLIGEEGFHEE